MTLSESVAIDSFSFLTIEDNPSDPSSQQSVEGVSPVTMEQRSSREGSLESSGAQVTRGDVLRGWSGVLYVCSLIVLFYAVEAVQPLKVPGGYLYT